MVEPGWLLSPPGRPYLASILHKNQRRVFGETLQRSPTPPTSTPNRPKRLTHPLLLPPSPSPSPPGLLERPALPPALSVPTVTYKLFVSGRSGVGKTALVAALAGSPVPPLHRETLGMKGRHGGRGGNTMGMLSVTVP